MLLVYAENITARLAYACRVAFLHCVQGLAYELTADAARFAAYYGPRLAYGSPPPDAENVPWMDRSALLYSTGAASPPPVLPVSDKTPERLKYTTDPLAAFFWHTTCYGEYNTFTLDAHGRVERPSTNIRDGAPHAQLIILKLLAWLKGHYPTLSYALPPRQLQLTVDIDNAYAYAHKGPAHNLGGLIKDVVTGHARRAARRLAWAIGARPDPYDNHAALLATLQAGVSWAAMAPPIAFWLVARGQPPDRALPIQSPAMRKLLTRYAQAGVAIGLHPGYHKGNTLEGLLTEKAALEQAYGHPITAARMHYLRCRVPDTLRLLVAAGITDDYSLAWPDGMGYRAGMSVPYLWFDVEADKEQPLTLHPPAFMDVTCQYLPDRGLAVLKQLYEGLAETGGTFSAILHNDYYREGLYG